jgi:hypothetical protein
MRHRLQFLLALSASLGVLAGPVLADALGDAKAGLAALDRGDSAAAIPLFTRALNGKALKGPDRELAYVKRAKAYLGAGQQQAALADARKALALAPDDPEAAEVREAAEAAEAAVTSEAAGRLARTEEADAMLNAKITAQNREVDARNQAVQAQFEAQQRSYEAAKQTYEAQVAQQRAQTDALARQHAADIAAWQNRVRACAAGDTAQCGR